MTLNVAWHLLGVIYNDVIIIMVLEILRNVHHVE
jgi:hypothetical protein